MRIKWRCHFPLLFFFVLLLQGYAGFSQTTIINGPPGSGQFGYVTVLTNGNFVVRDLAYSEGGVPEIGAVYLYDGVSHTIISILKGVSAYDRIGSAGVFRLDNGNFVVFSPQWDNGAVTDAGAVTSCSGTTGLNGTVNTGNSLYGTTANDQIGNGTIINLTNGNYIVRSFNWDNGAVVDAGALTWCNAVAAPTGPLSNTNSLVGSSAGDKVGYYTWALPNGNAVALSTYWDNGAAADAGAITWINGNTGITGIVSSTNSLVGTKSNDQAGYYFSITVLTNSNYVIASPYWDNGPITDAGAVTWGSGIAPLTGVISSANSLVGGMTDDKIGSKAVIALSNGNYAVVSPFWKPGPPSYEFYGAVTWGNGSTGTSGVVSGSNSLTGDQPNDMVGNGGVFPLTNGNYVVSSVNWPANAAKGAVTWCDGNLGKTGFVSTANSITGSSNNDRVGSGSYIRGGIVPLTNGNYVIVSPYWDNGTAVDAGAVTWVNGNAAATGILSNLNSLVGGSPNDQVGAYEPSNGNEYVFALSNGNYVVGSHYWDNGTVVDAGAVTWCDGAAGTSGIISAANSLVGSTNNDQVGRIYLLTNGNYVVDTENWDNGSTVDAGAVTWGDGSLGVKGIITAANSLIGTSSNDKLGASGDVRPLANGNYVIGSRYWNNGTIADAGAITWVNGTAGITGAISAANSLVGTQNNDQAGSGLNVTPNGDYYCHSANWDNGSVVNAGATSFANGLTGLTGYITPCNSVLGNIANGAYPNVVYNTIFNYQLLAKPFENTVILFTPSATTLANINGSQSQNITGTSPVSFYSDNCKLVATVQPNGASPAAGLITAKIWLEPSVPVFGGKPFVARHYEITPADNAVTATARLTLYFTQQDFDDFNAAPGSVLDLPAGPSDIFGKANLKIGKYPGTSNNGTGLPGSYTQPGQVINPADNDIVWNSSLNRWEVSFNVTGFSGFIVQTNNFLLPLDQLRFSAIACGQQQVCIDWNTTDESAVVRYIVQRSTDGFRFQDIAEKPAANGQSNAYTVKDDVHGLATVPVLYYRLKIIRQQGDFSYSKIEKLSQPQQSLQYVYPNPVKDVLHVYDANTVSSMYLCDMKGSFLYQCPVHAGEVNMQLIPPGVYIVHLVKKDGGIIRQKIIKN